MKAYNGFPGPYRESQYEHLKKAWALGIADRPTKCIACGSTGSTMNAHHEDYSTPLTYDALCCVCHLMVHCRFQNLDAWARYCEAVRAGYQPPDTKQPQAMRAVRFLTAQPVNVWPGLWGVSRARETTVLDRYPLFPIIHPNAAHLAEEPHLPL